MAQYAFDDPMAGGVRSTRRSGGSGWKALFWLTIAATGVGFAGYVFLVPYQKTMSALNARSTELGEERATSKQLTIERDQLKTDVEKLSAAASSKAAVESKRKGTAEELGTQLKTAVEGLGATVVSANGRIAMSLPVDKIIDTNGIDVSEPGRALLKIFAGVVKNTPGGIKIKARFSPAPPVKELRELFKTAGELSAVRSARVMSVLNDAGLAPDRLTIIGEAERPRPVPKLKKGMVPPPPPTERVDIEIEPE
jgi:flagellar motor protein MotB